MKQPFKMDIEALRRRARDKMYDGAVTEAYRADRQQVIAVLNEALATEIVCVLRYTQHYMMATGAHAGPARAEFLEHAQEEQRHMMQIAERITQLGGSPDFDPKGLHTRSHAQYVAGGTLEEMIKEDLVAERIAIETYSEIIRWLGDDDPTTQRLMKEILTAEEEHADDLLDLLGDGDKEASPTPSDHRH
jgi:bacterioferritin